MKMIVKSIEYDLKPCPKCGEDGEQCMLLMVVEEPGDLDSENCYGRPAIQCGGCELTLAGHSWETVAREWNDRGDCLDGLPELNDLCDGVIGLVPNRIINTNVGQDVAVWDVVDVTVAASAIEPDWAESTLVGRGYSPEEAIRKAREK